METNNEEGTLSALCGGFFVGFLATAFLFAWLVALAFSYTDVAEKNYQRIQNEAVSRGFADWGETTQGERVFVWKDR